MAMVVVVCACFSSAQMDKKIYRLEVRFKNFKQIQKALNMSNVDIEAVAVTATALRRGNSSDVVLLVVLISFNI